MNLRILRLLVGLFLILGHFTAIFYVAFFHPALSGTEEAWEVIAILAPLCATFTMAIVVDFVRYQFDFSKGKKVNLGFSFVAIFFPIVFMLSIILLLHQFSAQQNSMAYLTKGLGWCESGVGAFLGLIVSSLFRAEGER